MKDTSTLFNASNSNEERVENNWNLQFTVVAKTQIHDWLQKFGLVDLF